MVVTKEILQSHTVATLKKKIAESNMKLDIIKAYSKGKKKAEIIDLMLKPEHIKRFKGIKMAPKKEKKAPPKKEKKEKKEKKAPKKSEDPIKKLEKKVQKIKFVPTGEKKVVGSTKDKVIKTDAQKEAKAKAKAARLEKKEKLKKEKK